MNPYREPAASPDVRELEQRVDKLETQVLRMRGVRVVRSVGQWLRGIAGDCGINLMVAMMLLLSVAGTLLVVTASYCWVSGECTPLECKSDRLAEQADP